MLWGMKRKAKAARTAMMAKNSPIRRRRAMERAAPMPARMKSQVSPVGNNVVRYVVIRW